MRHEVKQSLRKALSILLIILSLFAFAQARWPIGVAVLIVAFWFGRRRRRVEETTKTSEQERLRGVEHRYGAGGGDVLQGGSL